MDILNKRYFKPWVGKYYKSKHTPSSPRILILGESIYRCDQTSESRVIELIHNNATGVESHKFYTNIYLAFQGHDASRESTYKSKFWESVAYINYIDDIVEGGSRVSPSNASIQKAKQEFTAVLSALEPEVIIVLGKRCWNWLPKTDNEREIEIDSNCHTIREYPVAKYGSAVATWVYHPSVGFSSKRWHKVIDNIIRHYSDYKFNGELSPLR